MTDVEMKIELETEDFTEELSDEALDRGEGGVGKLCNWCLCSGPLSAIDR